MALEGDLDFHSAASLAEALPEAGSVEGLVIDCRQVKYIDSAALGILVSFRKRFMQAGGDPKEIVIVTSAGGPVRKILDIAGLSRFFHNRSAAAGCADPVDVMVTASPAPVILSDPYAVFAEARAYWESARYPAQSVIRHRRNGRQKRQVVGRALSRVLRLHARSDDRESGER